MTAKGQGVALGGRIAKNGIVAQFLQIELFLTVFLDVANELLGIAGVPLVLGQVVRACFLVINLFVVFECGKRKESQVVVLIYLFVSLLVLREVSLGISGMSYAAAYWAKFLLYVSTFFAVKCAGDAGKIERATVERFFKWSVVFIAPAFLILAMAGLLEQSTFDSGYEGTILSKNSMSAVLLLLLAIAMFLAFRKQISPLWIVVVVSALFFLGSKSAIVFAVVAVGACILNELRRLTPRGILVLLVLVGGMGIALWLYRDTVWSVVNFQLQRYQYVLAQQGGSFVDYLLTGRNTLLAAGLSSYVGDFNPITFVFGSGISALSFDVAEIMNAAGTYRGIEMDFFEIALASGIVGLLITSVPFVIALRSLKRAKVSKSLYLALGIFIVVCFMALGGHVVTEGMPASYLGVYLAYVYLLSDDKALVDKELLEQTVERGASCE